MPNLPTFPKAGHLLLIALLVLGGCGKQKSPEAGQGNSTTAVLPDDWQTGQIFSDRIRKGWYGPEMLVIGAGQFTLGALKKDKNAPANEKPPHAVVLSAPFAISRAEITVAEFELFVKNSAYKTVAEIRGNSKVYDLASGRMIDGIGVDWRHDHLGKPSKAENPVVHVAFADALAYTAWLSKRTGKSYRLPTEAEWEYVYRSGIESVYPWGDKIKRVEKGNLSAERDTFPNGRTLRNAIAGYGDGYWALAPVRRYSSEGFGTFDMLGNVSEWVEDCWHENYRRAPANGEAWVNPGCKERVVRGSSWLSAVDQSRISFRMPVTDDETSALIGFRVVRQR
jgi:formylglycine-generating enzyme required for sulfatase activity